MCLLYWRKSKEATVTAARQRGEGEADGGGWRPHYGWSCGLLKGFAQPSPRHPPKVKWQPLDGLEHRCDLLFSPNLIDYFLEQC